MNEINEDNKIICKCPFCEPEIKENMSDLCTPCETEFTEKFDEVLDCTGLYCPAPVFETRKKIDSLKTNQILLMLADDPASEEDMRAWAKRTGNELLSVEKYKDIYKFLIKKTS
ncbi:MAG: sulfurtransferase TusA family protein [Actinobacteria bacterium]|nr:sulfurtransferase TusA family protein [Cyanobacteriota bacterium]MCL5772281.1 sulfurtransferase TusA family protein [Actinomycetota bacterium]